jgi:exodeoxyribonuclease VII large subunit
MPQPTLFSDEPEPEEPQVLSVCQLTAQIKDVVEGSFPAVWVTGEISNLARPQSGHAYFTLKDDRAQIGAAIWRTTLGRVRFKPHDGLEVICRGRIEVYAPRGSYQLIVEHIEPRGIGALELAFRQLHEKLAREGLFDPARKRPLPSFARRIAVVTSPSGAAIRDFLQVLHRRWRGTDVLIVPTRVQGEGASREIAAAIASVDRLACPVDCLVVTRGGGSIEDLWAFNEEPVVRAIAAARVPVVSAIGHEIDVTLADLAADVRALTPSEAAELVVPAAEELAAGLAQWQRRLTGAMRLHAARARSRVAAVEQSMIFRRPQQRLHDLARRLDELEARSGRSVDRRMQSAGQHVSGLAARLEALSPLAVLGRGYSLTHRRADGRLVREVGDLAVGEQIATRLARGQVVSRVEALAE